MCECVETAAALWGQNLENALGEKDLVRAGREKNNSRSFHSFDSSARSCPAKKAKHFRRFLFLLYPLMSSGTYYYYYYYYYLLRDGTRLKYDSTEKEEEYLFSHSSCPTLLVLTALTNTTYRRQRESLLVEQHDLLPLIC
jgi:hypothetical protein